MTNLAEIQEAIEKLTPEERAALREWLDESDPDPWLSSGNESDKSEEVKRP